MGPWHSIDSQPPDRKVFAKRSQNCLMCWNEISSQGDGSNIIPATDVGVPHKRQVPKGGRVGKKYNSTKLTPISQDIGVAAIERGLTISTEEWLTQPNQRLAEPEP